MEEKYNLNFMDAYLDKEYIYAVSRESNIFFRAKRHNGYSVEILGVINGFRNAYAGKIYTVQHYKNSLYMFADSTYEVARYDFESRKFSYYCPAEQKEGFDIVRGSCRIGNEVWILRDSFDGKLCVFSLEDCSYRFFDLDISILINSTKQKNVQRVPKENVCLVGNKVWRCIPGTNYLYAIDVTTKRVELYKVESDIDIFTISHDEQGFYLISIFGDYVIQWDENRGVIDKKDINGGEKAFKAFRDILHVNGGYILLPNVSDHIKFLSEAKGMIEECELPAQFYRTGKVKGLFFQYLLENDRLLLFPFGGNGLIEMDTNTLQSEYHPICISKEECIKVLLAANKEVTESEMASLDSYISLLDSNYCMRKKEYSPDGAIGRRIMKTIEGSL